MRLGRLVLGLLAVLAVQLCQPAGHAQAGQTPGVQAGAAVAVTAAEAVLIDTSGTRLLGHGRVFAGRLTLEMADIQGRFVLLLIDDDGNIERHVGMRTFDGRLVVQLEGGVEIELHDFFAGRGIALQYVRPRDSSAGVGEDGPGDSDDGDDHEDDRDDDHDDGQEDDRDDDGDGGDEGDEGDEDDDPDDDDRADDGIDDEEEEDDGDEDDDD